MSDDAEVARFRAASDQSKAGIADMACHLAVFYKQLIADDFNEAHAFELTNTLLVESLAADDD